MRYSLNAKWELRGCFVFLAYVKSSLIIKNFQEENVSKVGHGSKMGQNESDCACVSGVFTFLFLSCFIAHTVSLRAWKYGPASGPFFFRGM